MSPRARTLQLTALLRCISAATVAAAAAPSDAVLRTTQTAARGLLRTGLLHAACLCGPSVSIASELWEALSVLSWQERYAIYTHWQDSVYEPRPGPRESALSVSRSPGVQACVRTLGGRRAAKRLRLPRSTPSQYSGQS